MLILRGSTWEEPISPGGAAEEAAKETSLFANGAPEQDVCKVGLILKLRQHCCTCICRNVVDVYESQILYREISKY